MQMPVVIFKSTRLILSQSTETVKKNNFNFEIVHRFGDFAGQNGGGRFFYGLDDIADVTLRFEYGLTDNFNADLERSTICQWFLRSLGLGIQIETGGHVFTLNITNARAISEINYLSDTESDFSKGQYRIGFTISRMFDFNRKEAYK